MVAKVKRQKRLRPEDDAEWVQQRPEGPVRCSTRGIRELIECLEQPEPTPEEKRREVDSINRSLRKIAGRGATPEEEFLESYRPPTIFPGRAPPQRWVRRKPCSGSHRPVTLEPGAEQFYDEILAAGPRPTPRDNPRRVRSDPAIVGFFFTSLGETISFINTLRRAGYTVTRDGMTVNVHGLTPEQALDLKDQVARASR